jgi:hypothetical protein
MNEIYIVDGKEYEVAPNRKEEFLAKFPNAQLVSSAEQEVVEETGKQTAVAEEVATVTAENPEATGDLELYSGELSLEQEGYDPDYISTGEKIRSTIDNLETAGVLPVGSGFVTDKATKLIRATSDLLSGVPKLARGVGETLAVTYAELFDPELVDTVEKRKALADAVGGMSIPGQFSPTDIEQTFEKISSFAEDLETTGEDYQQSISENLKEGDLGVALDQIIGGVVEAAPSVGAAFLGPGGLALIGASSAGNHYDEISELKPEKLGAGLLGTSIVQGGVELLSETVTRGIGGRAMKLFKEGNKVAGKEAVKSVARNIAKDAFYEGSSEVAANEVNNLIDQTINDVDRFYTPDGEFDMTSLLRRSFDTFLISSIVGGGITGGAQLTARQKQLAHERLTPEGLKRENKEIASQINKLHVANKELKNEAVTNSIKTLEEQIAVNKAYAGEVLDSMTQEDQVAYARNAAEIADAKQQIKNQELSEVAKTELESIVKVKEDVNNKIFADTAKAWETKQKAIVGETIENQVKVIEDISGIEATVYQNEKEIADKYLKRLQFLQDQGVDFDLQEGETINDLVENLQKNRGNILQYTDADGNFTQEIFVNKEKSVDAWDKAVGSHEILHGVLAKAIGTDKQAFNELTTKIKEYVGKNNPELIDRIEADLENKGYSEEVKAEEFINSLSDLMVNNKLTYTKTLGETIKTYANRLLKPILGDNTFKSGKSAYAFIKDYSRAMKKGQLTKAAQNYLVREGVLSPDENIVKEARSEEASQRVQEIYEEQGEAGAFDIIEQFKPITSKLVERRSEAPGFDRQLLTDEIETGQRGIIDLISEYNPDSGVPLAAYINKFLPARAIEASKRVLGEEFTEDVTEARGIAAEEVTVNETPTKPEVKAIDPFRIMPDAKEAATSEVQKSITDKDVDVTEVTYKELKDVAPYQTVADFFNIPVSRIANPKDNLRKSDDVANIQRWILKNEPTLKSLFTEANREVVEIKEGNRVIRKGGEPTAIPRNLLNKFYTKGARVGNNFQWTLKPYNRTTFLEAVGIKDGKVDPNFTPRAAEAQTIKGILDMYTRNLGNVIARENIEAREDITPAKKARAKAEVAKGKPRLMMKKDIKEDVLKQYFDRITRDLTEDQIEQEISYIQDQSEALGVTNEEVIRNLFTNDNSYKKLRNTLGLPQGGKNKISSVENSTALRQTQKDFVKSMIPEGKTFNELPKSYQQFVIDTIGFGDTRMTLGGVPLTYKAYNSDKDYSSLLTVAFGNDVLIGTGKEVENIDAVFAPRNWGEKGFRGKVEKIVNQKDITPEQAKEQVEKLLTKEGKTIDETLKANIEVLNNAYESLADVVIKNPNLKSLEAITDLLESQVNRATGIFKGLVPVTSFNMKPEKGTTKNQNKKMHNEHLVELFNANKNFLNLLNDFIKGNITEQELKKGIRRNTETLEQAVISERMRVEKDASGASVRDFADPLTFLGKDAENQIPIGTKTLPSGEVFTGLNMAEFIAQNLTQKQIQRLAREQRENLSSEGVMVKQITDNKESYDNTKRKNNNKIPARFRQSKDATNQNVLKTMSDLDSEANKASKELFDSADLNKGFNDILEQTTGIASEKRYKRVKAEVAGAARGKAIRGIPYSAQDLVGLLYETLGKGKLGDAQMAWWTENLLKPYAKAMNEIDAARLSMMQDYRALKKQLDVVPKDLRKKIPGEPFTREQAARVYIWNQQGMEVPGISEADLKNLNEFVESNSELKAFADQIIAIQKGDQYAKPKEGWPAGSITTDLLESINTVKRAKYLEQWKANKDVIFSKENMNKLEAAYGKKYRKAMENMLERMQSGRNRRFSDDSLTGRFTDWLQGSIGTIMFFNTRSALLQTISSINFVNFTDNNPLAAAKAFGNQKQYWSDFIKLINSDFLKARRSGLRMNVNEADIADMAKKGGPRAVINKLLQLGFAPTQIADSFAIASGGATFYRNRINTYKKQGLSQQEAETKAFEDFRENAEESQQSARPDRISMQQAGGLGRLILAFQNTPSQYARIIDKSVRDLKNGRGDAKTNISKIIYYSTVQNLLFNALQQALFAFAFDDEEKEDEEKEEKYVNIANGMMDSLLRGTGVAGGVMSVLKNAILRIVRESEKARPKYEKVGADLLKIAPPVSSKLSKINQAARSYEWDKEEMKEKGWSLDNPAYLAGANVISALTNIPLDRGIKKANNVVNATNSDLETWERLALLGGWQDWEIGVDEENPSNKPQPIIQPKKIDKTKPVTF